MNKTILALSLIIFIFFFLIPRSAYASTIFSDDFENGSSKWNVLLGNWVIRDGKYGAIAPDTYHNAESLANLDITTPDYSIELDMYPIRGIDRTIRFRRDSNIISGVYDMHFTNDGIIANYGLHSNYVLVNHPYEDNYSYHIKVILKGQRFQFLIDNQVIFDFVDSNYVFDGHESFSLVVATGTVPTEAYFDNVRIYTDQNEDDSSLNVPLLKQTDPLWKDEIYDSANVWSPGNPFISRWGCAITSAAMVLNYNNINKLPDGTDLNPKSLNSYLKSVPDGYVRNGATNWIRVANIAKLAKFQNPNFQYDALEYLWHNNDNSILDQDLANNIPDILQVTMPNNGMHFVVAKGNDNGEIQINDPGFNNNTLASYGNTYVSSRRYIPANSDLSYIMLVVNPNVVLDLKNSVGDSVGDSIVEEPIGDLEGTLQNPVGPLKTFYLPKPESGQYTLSVTSPDGNPFTLDEYFYDKDGNVKVSTVSGAGDNIYVVNFDKDDSNNSSSHELVTFDSLRQEIVNGYNNHEIDFGTHIALISLLDNAQKAKKVEISKKMLDQMLHLITFDKTISYNFSQELITDIYILNNSL